MCIRDSYITATNRLFYREGLELSIDVANLFDFRGCTSWSNMPNSYDDCVTAGVSEPGGTVGFGHGTHDHSQLVQGNQYFIEYEIGLFPFTFSPQDIEISYSWQEVYGGSCPWDTDNPWCKIGTARTGSAGRFFTTNISHFSENAHWWNHKADGSISIP